MNTNRSEPVAILLAAYNGGEYLAEQLDSILRQTFQSFTVYIHDDGSVDDTLFIINDYAKKYPHKIKVLKYPSSGGAAKNFFSMIQRVDSEYVMFSDQDDVWFADKIEKTYRCMKAAEKKNQDHCICVHSDLKIVDRNLNTIYNSFYNRNRKYAHKNSFPELLMTNICVGCTMMINRKLLIAARKYNDVNNIFMHDWWIALIASSKGEIVFIDEALTAYRQHDNNAVGAKLGQISIFSKIARFCDYVGYKKEHLQKQRKIAKELSGNTFLSDESRIFLRDLSVIDEQNKIRRILFYGKNGILLDGNIVLELICV